jgi:hypothetical protein
MADAQNVALRRHLAWNVVEPGAPLYPWNDCRCPLAAVSRAHSLLGGARRGVLARMPFMWSGGFLRLSRKILHAIVDLWRVPNLHIVLGRPSP